PRQKNLEAIIHTFWGSIVCILKARANIVHIHNIGPALVLPLLKLAKIKTVLTYHSINYQHPKWSKLAKVILKLGEFLAMK
ncbi:MAG: glycosyl transferase, partial [Flavobacteriales bacterium CG03_land_8_20_14_0_80_35_15]